MHRTDMAPSPINLVTTWVVYLLRMCQRGVLLFSCCGSIVVVCLYKIKRKTVSGKKGKVGDYSKVNDGLGSKNGKGKIYPIMKPFWLLMLLKRRLAGPSECPGKRKGIHCEVSF